MLVDACYEDAYWPTGGFVHSVMADYSCCEYVCEILNGQRSGREQCPQYTE